MNKKMTYDYGKLKSRILEMYGSYSKFTDKLDMLESTLFLKLSDKEVWEQNEICKSIQLLKLKNEEIGSYFFTNKV
ncbi:MAG: DUF739 family protein [Lachnospiraceae bacterium]|nr:DUF739 family protein [Lachnospiraceae bacterium]